MMSGFLFATLSRAQWMGNNNEFSVLKFMAVYMDVWTRQSMIFVATNAFICP